MNGTIEKRNYEAMMTDTASEMDELKVKSSPYSMAAVASGILLCAGIIVYAILTH